MFLFASALALVLLASAGCNLFTPPSHLTVSPATVSLDTATYETVATLHNAGTTSTSWTAASSDVQHLSVSPSSGAIPAGGSAAVSVSVHYYGLSQGQSIAPSITFDSAIGSAVLKVDFSMTGGGLAQCGALPSTLSVASVSGHARTAVAPAGRPVATLPDGRRYVPGEILVDYNASLAPLGAASPAARLQQLAATVRSDYRLQVASPAPAGAPELVRTSDTLSTLRLLQRDPRVKAAQLNYYLRPQAALIPNDPYLNQEWTMQDFGVEQAWVKETGATNATTIAIIDTGIQMDHPDLQAKIVGGCDFYMGDNDPTPGPGVDHGTHVAGIAGAIGDNTIGVAGVAFDVNARIEPIKIFDDTGSYATTSTLIDAIRWAAGLAVSGAAINPHPADVINMSVGVVGDQPLVDTAAQQAFDAGSLLVAASGNWGSGTPYATDPGVLSPANAPAVIAVGSVDSTYQISGFSDTTRDGSTLASGKAVELMAPGGFERTSGYSNGCPTSYGGVAVYSIVSTYTGSGYGCDSGTSMASPFVAGVAALLKSQNPTWSPTQLRQALDASVLNTGPASMPAAEYGYGIVCADVALNPTNGTTCGQ